jgi:hypothetical protein
VQFLAGFDDIVTLSFRSKATPATTSTESTKQSSSTKEKTGMSSRNFQRVNRRFSAQGTTGEDLLDFFESLNIAPNPVLNLELTLDFPTRTISRTTNNTLTLQELQVTCDSIVWVKFDRDDE